MENVRLLFHGTKESGTNQSTLELYATDNNELLLSIEGDGIQLINLNRATSIKLCKELKKQIALLD